MMDTVKGALTVYFEAPVRFGVLERVEDGRLSVSKITFGAEPKDMRHTSLRVNIILSFALVRRSRRAAASGRTMSAAKKEQKIAPARHIRARAMCLSGDRRLDFNAERSNLILHGLQKLFAVFGNIMHKINRDHSIRKIMIRIAFLKLPVF